MSWKIAMCGSKGRRGCGARVIWTETEKGKRMCVDATPSEEGTFVLLHASRFYGTPAEDNLTPYAVHVSKAKNYLTDAELVELTRYVPHFATCPEAGDFRR